MAKKYLNDEEVVEVIKEKLANCEVGTEQYGKLLEQLKMAKAICNSNKITESQIKDTNERLEMQKKYNKADLTIKKVGIGLTAAGAIAAGVLKCYQSKQECNCSDRQLREVMYFSKNDTLSPDGMKFLKKGNDIKIK